jgi:DNA-binding PadR family transcriptional regulator
MRKTDETPRKPSTTTSYAILGLLSVRSWTTYELAKQAQRSLNWFWPRAERKLYDEPKALVANGLASARKEYTGQRAGTVYDITADGRDALRRWLDEPPAPLTTEFEAMVKVFFADAGTLDQLKSTLDAIESGATQRLVNLAGLAEQSRAEEFAFPQRRHISALTLRLQYRQESAVLEWARWAGMQVEQWRTTTDPDRWDDQAELARLHDDIRDTLGEDGP